MSTLSQSINERQQKATHKKWFLLSQEDVLKKLKTTKNGLLPQEVAKRQESHGFNILPDIKKESKWELLLRQFKSSLVYILLAAGVISFILGDKIDAAIIFLAVLINVIVGFYQENKAQQALSALRKIVVNYCKVLRDGKEQQIKTDELVMGDIVFLSAGDKVPADLRLSKVNNLKINEAPLTGESAEVNKTDKILSGDLIVADQANMAFMGTQVSQGEAMGVVVATASKTALGKIAELVAKTEDLITPLQRKLNIFARKISLLILTLCSFILLAGLLMGYSFTLIFTTAVAIAVSAIPEGLLVVVTMILAIGMHRILKKKTLAKHLLAAEILGSIDVICTDKTGTLTEGEMRVVEVATLDYNLDFSQHNNKKITAGEELISLLKIGVICNNAYIENPSQQLGHRIVRGNPTEKALLLAGSSIALDKNELEKSEMRLDEIPFGSSWKYMVTLNRNGANYNTIYIKGAPEIILMFSDFIYSNKDKNNKTLLTDHYRQKIIKIHEDMSKRGLRVLACAYKKVGATTKSLKKLEKNNFIFVGLLGIKDPIRNGIGETIKKIRRAGIKTLMITGDHELTATAVANELGLPNKSKNIMNGQRLMKLSESELLEIVDDIYVYARVTPEDKLKIVKAWQEKGKVVAVTGDGINDAPALKKANVGIAIGSGTDVAKETADAILLDNNFKTIVAAIKEGRLIYSNIKKVILYFLSNAFSEIFVISSGLLLGWPLALLPAQIIWINLINDTFPALAMTHEPADKKIMTYSPRRTTGPLLSRQDKFLIGSISLLLAMITLFLFNYFKNTFNDINLARTVSFSFLAVSTLFYVFSIRNLNTPIWKINFFNNKFLLLSILIGLSLQLLVVYNSFLQPIFQTVALGLEEWMVIISACLMLIIIIEAYKIICYKKNKS